MTPFNLMVIMVFGLVVRGAFTAAVGSTIPEYGYEIDLIGQAGLNVLLVLLAWRVCGLTKSSVSRLFGRFVAGEVIAGISLGIVALCFTFGESALTTMFVARYDPALAYSLGSYHEVPLPADSFFSCQVVCFVLVNVVMAAATEEFYFRGLLVSALIQKRTFWRGVTIASLLFTALHLPTELVINIFLFAISLSWLYRLTRSLYPCIAAHLTYNLLAFLCQSYFDFHRVRSISQLSSFADWIPELSLLALSFVAGTVLWTKSRASADRADVAEVRKRA